MLARPTRRAWGYCDSSGERGTQLSAREGTQKLRRERHAHRWPSMVRGAMLATTWNLSNPPVTTILAGEHSRQGLREMLLKTPERGAVPELVYRHPQIAMHLPQKAVSPVQNEKDPQVLELQCWGPADQGGSTETYDWATRSRGLIPAWI